LSLRLRPPSSRGLLADADATILIPPAHYLDAVRRVLDVIDLDPCSTHHAQAAIDAQGWFKADDAQAALAEPWSGRVFLHPHPDTTLARYQLQKLLRDYLADRVTAAVILAGKTDWLRAEPLLLSFPWLLHYRRLNHWRWNRSLDQLEKINPSFNSFSLYLPAKKGPHFDEAKLERFIETFSCFGRVILSEDLGDGWEQDALLATARFPIKPVLTTTRLERYNQRPGASARLLYDDNDPLQAEVDP
jgi:hypothetical protein